MLRLGTSRLVIAIAALPIISDGVDAQNQATAPPHVSRQGENLIRNPSLRTKANWSFLRDAEYDASTSRTDEGSGAMKLLTPLPKASMVLSYLIAVQPGRRYTYGFYSLVQSAQRRSDGDRRVPLFCYARILGTVSGG
jgi:hypothetical protein